MPFKAYNLQKLATHSSKLLTRTIYTVIPTQDLKKTNLQLYTNVKFGYDKICSFFVNVIQ